MSNNYGYNSPYKRNYNSYDNSGSYNQRGGYNSSGYHRSSGVGSSGGGSHRGRGGYYSSPSHSQHHYGVKNQGSFKNKFKPNYSDHKSRSNYRSNKPGSVHSISSADKFKSLESEPIAVAVDPSNENEKERLKKVEEDKARLTKLLSSSDKLIPVDIDNSQSQSGDESEEVSKKRESCLRLPTIELTENDYKEIGAIAPPEKEVEDENETTLQVFEDLNSPDPDVGSNVDDVEIIEKQTEVIDLDNVVSEKPETDDNSDKELPVNNIDEQLPGNSEEMKSCSEKNSIDSKNNEIGCESTNNSEEIKNSHDNLSSNIHEGPESRDSSKTHETENVDDQNVLVNSHHSEFVPQEFYENEVTPQVTEETDNLVENYLKENDNNSDPAGVEDSESLSYNKPTTNVSDTYDDDNNENKDSSQNSETFSLKIDDQDNEKEKGVPSIPTTCSLNIIQEREKIIGFIDRNKVNTENSSENLSRIGKNFSSSKIVGLYRSFLKCRRYGKSHNLKEKLMNKKDVVLKENPFLNKENLLSVSKSVSNDKITEEKDDRISEIVDVEGTQGTISEKSNEVEPMDTAEQEADEFMDNYGHLLDDNFTIPVEVLRQLGLNDIADEFLMETDEPVEHIATKFEEPENSPVQRLGPSLNLKQEIDKESAALDEGFTEEVCVGNNDYEEDRRGNDDDEQDCDVNNDEEGTKNDGEVVSPLPVTNNSNEKNLNNDIGNENAEELIFSKPISEQVNACDTLKNLNTIYAEDNERMEGKNKSNEIGQNIENIVSSTVESVNQMADNVKSPVHLSEATCSNKDPLSMDKSEPKVSLEGLIFKNMSRACSRVKIKNSVEKKQEKLLHNSLLKAVNAEDYLQCVVSSALKVQEQFQDELNPAVYIAKTIIDSVVKCCPSVSDDLNAKMSTVLNYLWTAIKNKASDVQLQNQREQRKLEKKFQKKNDKFRSNLQNNLGNSRYFQENTQILGEPDSRLPHNANLLGFNRLKNNESNSDNADFGTLSSNFIPFTRPEAQNSDILQNVDLNKLNIDCCDSAAEVVLSFKESSENCNFTSIKKLLDFLINVDKKIDYLTKLKMKIYEDIKKCNVIGHNYEYIQEKSSDDQRNKNIQSDDVVVPLKKRNDSQTDKTRTRSDSECSDSVPLIEKKKVAKKNVGKNNLSNRLQSKRSLRSSENSDTNTSARCSSKQTVSVPEKLSASDELSNVGRSVPSRRSRRVSESSTASDVPATKGCVLPCRRSKRVSESSAVSDEPSSQGHVTPNCKTKQVLDLSVLNQGSAVRSLRSRRISESFQGSDDLSKPGDRVGSSKSKKNSDDSEKKKSNKRTLADGRNSSKRKKSSDIVENYSSNEDAVEEKLDSSVSPGLNTSIKNCFVDLSFENLPEDVLKKLSPIKEESTHVKGQSSDNNLNESRGSENSDTVSPRSLRSKRKQAPEEQNANIAVVNSDSIPNQQLWGTCIRVNVVKEYEDDLFVGCDDGRILRLKPKGDLLNHVYSGHDGPVNSIEFYNDYLLTGSSDSTIIMHGLSGDKKIVAAVPVVEPVQTFLVKWQILFIGSKNGKIRRFSCHKKCLVDKEIVVGTNSDYVLAIHAANEGPRRILIVAAKNQPLTIRDAKTGLLLRNVSFDDVFYSLAFYSSTPYVYCGTRNNSVVVIDFTSGKKMSSLNLGKNVVKLIIKYDIIVTASYDGNVHIYNLKENQLIAKFPVAGLIVEMELWNNKIVLSTSNNGPVVINFPKELREYFQKKSCEILNL